LLMNALLKTFVTLAIVFIFMICAGLGYIIYTVNHYYLPSPSRVVIEKGQGLKEISAILESSRVIPDKYSFTAVLYYNSNYLRHFIIPGEYEFSQGSTPADALHKLFKGDRVVRKAIIPEGYTSFQITKYIAGLEGLNGEITTHYPEGYLMPATYFYYWGDSRQSILDKMHKEMTSYLSSNQIANPAETLTLASIVEKEARVAEERPIVASVYLNRMKLRMPLQADPTVIYAIYAGKTDFRHSLTKQDLSYDSPYNTYTNRGLPPGPIANPGKAAIQAVLSPASTTYLYFVADGTGRHRFATSLVEHNKNVQIYLASLKNQS